MQKAVQQTIDSGTSLRGVEKNLKLDAYEEEFSTPSFSSVRNWLRRIGLYELQREKEYRTDWVFIIDITAGIGKQKCLVILGVSQQYLKSKVFPLKRGLQHHEVQVLALSIMESTRGELIEQKLSEVTNLVGEPLQIIADHGSDLKKGIKLYKQNHPSVVYNYDVTHAMALLLKNELVNSEKYQSFLHDCNQCRNQLQQTELSFLSPPSQRYQCRYFNVDRLIDWAQKVLNCKFDTLFELVSSIPPETLRQKLIDKFSWLLDYQSEISIWGQMVLMTRTVETQLKKYGINRESLINFELKEFSQLDNYCSDFKQKIIDYIVQEISQIPKGKTLLATSDIIESIFGKYKQFSSRTPVKQMGQMVLNISLATMKLTNSYVKKALETVRYIDLKAWSSQVFGQSILSKRKIIFLTSNNDTEFA